jgi:hypothetical protein
MVGDFTTFLFASVESWASVGALSAYPTPERGDRVVRAVERFKIAPWAYKI